LAESIMSLSLIVNLIWSILVNVLASY